MNRRAFLKLFIGTVAVATLPIPRFLLKEERDTDLFKIGDGVKPWESLEYDSSGGVLTMEMIEEAAKRAIENHGTPDRIYLSPARYKAFVRWQVVYGN